MPAKEHHERHFKGVWIPIEILDLAITKQITHGDVLLLSNINALTSRTRGCYASNRYLAETMGWTPRNTQERIAKLRKMGLLHDVGGGIHRELETAWCRVEGVTPHVTPPTTPTSPPTYTTDNNTLPSPNGADGGFGMVEPEGIPPTEFDIGITTELLDACRRHLGASHKYVRRAKVSQWADYIRKLRTTDKVEEARIRRVMDWYHKAIGEEFVPQAFSGEAFRNKFERLEAACKRDILSTTTVTQDARDIAARLAMLGWPKGTGEAVPAATQACLDAYGAWIELRNGFNKKLMNGTAAKYADATRLFNLGLHLARTMPAPSQFVEGWMRAVNTRINGWDGFHGELAPYIFKPEQKKFRSMGRGWAEAYCSDPDRWDRYTEVMNSEG